MKRLPRKVRPRKYIYNERRPGYIKVSPGAAKQESGVSPHVYERAPYKGDAICPCGRKADGVFACREHYFWMRKPLRSLVTGVLYNPNVKQSTRKKVLAVAIEFILNKLRNKAEHRKYEVVTYG